MRSWTSQFLMFFLPTLTQYHLPLDMRTKQDVRLKNANRSTALECSVIDYCVCGGGRGGGLTIFAGSKLSPFAFSGVETFGPLESFLTHQ